MTHALDLFVDLLQKKKVATAQSFVALTGGASTRPGSAMATSIAGMARTKSAVGLMIRGEK